MTETATLEQKVLNVVKDALLEETTRENKALKEQVEAFIELLRYANVMLLVPPEQWDGFRSQRDGMKCILEGSFDLLKCEEGDDRLVLGLDGFLPVCLDDVFESKIRIGDFIHMDMPLFSDGAWNSFYLTGLWCNEETRAYFDFRWECEVDGNDPVVILGTIGGGVSRFTVQDYCTLSGDISEEEVMESFYEANGHGFVQLFTTRMFRVDVEDVARLFGDNFHLEIDSVTVPLRVVKKKCNLL